MMYNNDLHNKIKISNEILIKKIVKIKSICFIYIILIKFQQWEPNKKRHILHDIYAYDKY